MLSKIAAIRDQVKAKYPGATCTSKSYPPVTKVFTIKDNNGKTLGVGNSQYEAWSYVLKIIQRTT